jgi:hypothetical protein
VQKAVPWKSGKGE